MNQEKISDSSKKRLLFFAAMLFIGAVLLIVYSVLTGNTNQKFTDVVIEYTAMDGSNKSAERSLFYLFSIIGALVYAFVFTICKWGQKDLTDVVPKPSAYVLIALAVSFGANLILYKTVHYIVLMAIALSIVLLLFNNDKVLAGVAFYFLAIYGLCGLYRIYVFVGGSHSAGVNKLAAVAFAISVVGVLLQKKFPSVYIKSIMVVQLIIPFTLLVFLMNSYLYNGDMINIHVPNRVAIFIWIVLVAFVVLAALKLKNNWKSEATLNDVLSFGTVVSIMSFNRFSGSGAIEGLSLHHSFENVIGYSQIFQLGQKAFEDYIPVSGMYSILQGFFLAFFGRDKATNYYLTANLMYLCIIFVVAFFLMKQLKAEWVLFIALVFKVTDYNRITLIVPMVLLLLWPKLIENKNLWLKAWFLSSFIHGLYYPVFGAAVCIGFMPLGIYQIYTYAKSGKLKDDVKHISFWIWWIVCFVPVVLGLRLLLGTLKHILAMGSQTIYADGITRFGQAVPDFFLTYVPSETFRIIVYYLASYLVLISIIWIAVAIFMRLISVGYIEGALVGISIAIMLLISFSYTVVRLDFNDLYSRSDGMIRAAFVVIVVIVARYLKDVNRNVLWIFTFVMLITSVASQEAVFDLSGASKLESCYTVPEGYVYMQDDGQTRMGEGFIDEENYVYVNHINAYMNTLDRDAGYLGLVDSFGLHYLCNIKGDSVMEIFNTIRGYDATVETVDYIRRNKTIVGLNMNPDSNYYLFHWLLTSGDYIWNNDLRLFIPNDGSVTREQILEANKTIDLSLESADVGRVAGSFGTSMDSLEPIFTELNNTNSIVANGKSTDIIFEEAFDGNQADYMYIEFADMDINYSYMQFIYNGEILRDDVTSPLTKALMKKEYNPGMNVTVTWSDEAGAEHSMACSMDEGKLLVPLGAGRGWLLNEHSNVRITVAQDGENINVPDITSIRLLKLREVQ